MMEMDCNNCSSASIENSEYDDENNTPIKNITKNDKCKTWHWYSSFFLFGVFLSSILMFVFHYRGNVNGVKVMIPIGTICVFAFGKSLDEESYFKTVYEIMTLE